MIFDCDQIKMYLQCFMSLLTACLASFQNKNAQQSINLTVLNVLNRKCLKYLSRLRLLLIIGK